MRRWARSMNTMKVTTATDDHQEKDDEVGEIAPVRPSSRVAASACGRLRDDAGQDDQRDAVADAARGDLLAEPHQEHRAADQGHDRDQAEEQPGIEHRRFGAGMHALEPDRDAVGLHRAPAGPCRSGYIG